MEPVEEHNPATSERGPWDFLAPVGKSWRALLNTLLNPWVLLLVACVAFLQYKAPGLVGAPPFILTAFSVLLTISTVVLGGVVVRRWDELTEEKVLVARGETAIRSLKLLVDNVTAMRRRATQYLDRHMDEEARKRITHEVVRTYLEEVILNLKNLEIQSLGSIDNWKDIIPQADVNTQVALVRELARDKLGTEQELAELRKGIVEASKADADVTALRKRIGELERRLSETSRQAARADPFGIGTSGTFSSGGQILTSHESRIAPSGFIFKSDEPGSWMLSADSGYMVPDSSSLTFESPSAQLAGLSGSPDAEAAKKPRPRVGITIRPAGGPTQKG